MNIVKCFDQSIMSTPHGVDAKMLFSSDNVVFTVITLQVGEALKPHITPVDVLFFVLSGSGTVEIGEEKETVFAYDLIESPKDIKHCWYNTSQEELRFLVIKTPKPTAKTIFL